MLGAKAALFDDNRLNDEMARGLRKLAELQRQDGAWPWFPGGPANDYITLYIATGFGRLRHLGVDLESGNLFAVHRSPVAEFLARGTKAAAAPAEMAAQLTDHVWSVEELLLCPMGE